MRTEAKVLTSTVAVPAQHTETKRKTKRPQLPIEGRSANIHSDQFNPMRRTIVTRMVKRQEGLLDFATASTSAAVRVDRFAPKFCQIGFVVEAPRSFWLAFPPCHVVLALIFLAGDALRFSFASPLRPAGCAKTCCFQRSASFASIGASGFWVFSWQGNLFSRINKYISLILPRSEYMSGKKSLWVWRYAR